MENSLYKASGLINQINPSYRETANELIKAGFLNFDGSLTQKCYEKQ